MATKSTKRHKKEEGNQDSFFVFFCVFRGHPAWLFGFAADGTGCWRGSQAKLLQRCGIGCRYCDHASLSSPWVASTMSLTALLPAAIPGLAVLSAGVARIAASGLSFAATLADSGVATPPVLPPPSKQELPAELQKKLEQFAMLLKERLGAMGISLSNPVELSADVLGGIEARGEQQDEQAVEQLLGQDQELSAAFFQLAAAFNQAMGQSNAAGLSMPWDVAGRAQGVKMTIGDGGAEMASK